MTKLEVSFTESQAEFLELDCDNPLFVGGPGCGKSYLLGFIAVQYGLHSPEAAIYIYAPENHHIRTIEAPNVLYWLDAMQIKHKGYNKHENAIFTEDPRCGNFYFKNMETPANMVGYESYVALVDELDTLDEKKAEEIWTAILMRNRQQPKGVSEERQTFDESRGKMMCRNKCLAFTTPEGYGFCYKTWELSENDEYQLVRGRTEDNPALSSKYVEGLRQRFPEHVANAYLTGHFVNMESLAVYYNYDPDLHNSYETIQPGENLHIGCDFNKNNTAATVYVKRNGGKEWHAVEELTEVRDAAELAQLIDMKWKRNGHKIFMYPDASGRAGNNTNNANLSAIQELEAKGFIIRAPKKNFLVIDRVDSMNRALANGQVFINREKCPAVSRCLVNQPYGKDGKPCKKTGYDHSNDATTYPIVFEMGPQKKLFPVTVTWI